VPSTTPNPVYPGNEATTGVTQLAYVLHHLLSRVLGHLSLAHEMVAKVFLRGSAVLSAPDFVLRNQYQV
jgi:hypothetical protein